MTSLLGLADGITRPSSRFRSSAAMRKYSAASSTSPRASACIGLPWSSVSRCPSSSRCCSIESAIRCSRAERANPFRSAIARRALCAASTARFASARVPFGTDAMVSPVAGLTASKVCPLSDSTHLPSTNIFRTDLATSTVMSPLQRGYFDTFALARWRPSSNAWA